MENDQSARCDERAVERFDKWSDVVERGLKRLSDVTTRARRLRLGITYHLTNSCGFWYDE